MTSAAEEDRFARQAELVPRERLTATPITIVGVGAIGRQVALQLAALGATRLALVDFDWVEATNLTTQGYRRADLGMWKTEATARAMAELDDRIRADSIVDRFRPRYVTGGVVFCCVDSITARSAIWRSVRESCPLWIDGRMLGEVLRVLTAVSPADQAAYQATLFTAEEAQRGSCTSRSTIYAASIAAGWMVHQFTRWLRRLPIDRDLTLNLLASELTVG